MTALDYSEIQRFLDVASGSPYGPLFFLDIYTGLRRGELLGLRWRAINLAAGSLSVTETIQRVTGRGLMSLEPKTDRSRRLVSIPPIAVAVLRGLKVKQREEREAVNREWSESEYVFSHWDGRPFHPDTVSHTFAALVQKAGIPHVRLHDLRHSHATLMMAEGINPGPAADRMVVV